MLSKFGTCRKCMFLTALGLAGSLLAYAAAVFGGAEMLRLPAALALTFFAAWSLLHLAGYVVNGRKEVKEGCSSCNSNSFALTRRGFMGAAAWLLASLGMKGVAAKIIHGKINDLIKNIKVIELDTVTKREMIQRALNDRNVSMLIDELTKKGYKPELFKAFVKKILDKYGETVYISVPFVGGKNAEARLGYLINAKGSRAFAAERSNIGGEISITLYYINTDGNVTSQTMDGDQDYWSCYWACWAECMAQECTPVPGVPPSGGVCEICWPLLETCLMFVPITWEACILAAGCFGVASGQCGWSCGQQCSQ